MDQNELLVAILVTALALGVLAGTISSYIAVGHFHRHTKYQLAVQQADLASKWEEIADEMEDMVGQARWLAEQRAIQLNRDNEFRVKTEAVAAALHATEQAIADDTTIHDMDQQWLPELRDQLNDTVMLPRIEEEST